MFDCNIMFSIKLLKVHHIFNCMYSSIQITYKAYCSEGYYGSDCRAHCPGNPRKCVVNGQTYCKMGTIFIETNTLYPLLLFCVILK